MGISHGLHRGGSVGNSLHRGGSDGDGLDGLLVHVGNGRLFLVDVGLSGNIDVLIARIFVHVRLSLDLLMDVGLSLDFDVLVSRVLVHVGLGSGVDLTGVVVGVHGGDSDRSAGGVSDGLGGIGQGLGGVSQGLTGVSGSVGQGDLTGRSGSDESKNSDLK